MLLRLSLKIKFVEMMLVSLMFEAFIWVHFSFCHVFLEVSFLLTFSDIRWLRRVLNSWGKSLWATFFNNSLFHLLFAISQTWRIVRSSLCHNPFLLFFNNFFRSFISRTFSTFCFFYRFPHLFELVQQNITVIFVVVRQVSMQQKRRLKDAILTISTQWTFENGLWFILFLVNLLIIFKIKLYFCATFFTFQTLIGFQSRRMLVDRIKHLLLELLPMNEFSFHNKVVSSQVSLN